MAGTIRGMLEQIKRILNNIEELTKFGLEERAEIKRILENLRGRLDEISRMVKKYDKLAEDLQEDYNELKVEIEELKSRTIWDMLFGRKNV